MILVLEAGFWSAKYEGGGALPEHLKGRWTSRIEAEKAINKYLVGRDGSN